MTPDKPDTAPAGTPAVKPSAPGEAPRPMTPDEGVDAIVAGAKEAFAAIKSGHLDPAGTKRIMRGLKVAVLTVASLHLGTWWHQTQALKRMNKNMSRLCMMAAVDHHTAVCVVDKEDIADEEDASLERQLRAAVATGSAH